MADDSVRTRLAAALHTSYRIERELGAGGMATVYLAHDLKHDRDVAIKVLHPDLGAALGSERFLSEIRTTARLQHPHILPLLDSGDANGLLYYVMPLVTGETLRGRLERERQVSVDDALRLSTQLASALDYAHRHGVIHRDIKPENILLHDNVALLADFGIALAVRDPTADRMTGTGLSLGTPTYMSPEQAAGERDLDARSDIYSLAAVVYEMLAGEPPITGATAQAVIAKLMTAVPTSLALVRAGISTSVDGAVMRALAKVPSDRFLSAAAFATALNLSSSGATVTTPRPARIRRNAIVLAALIVVIAVAGYAFRVRVARGGVIRRVAVLPLASGRSSADSGLAAEGVTRSIIESLTEAGAPVVGYRTVMRYQNSHTPIRDIANELGVDAVVVGTVTQVAGLLEVSLEMTDPATSENRWAHTFKGQASDVLILQQDAARQIATAMKSPLAADRAARLANARHVNPEAYSAYLLGQRLNQRYTAAASLQADGELRRSIALDSTFAPAYAELGNAIFYRAWFGGLSDSEARLMAKPVIDRAFALDPTSPEVIVARAGYRTTLEWDFAGAEADFRRAEALRPDAYTEDILAWFLALTFRTDEAQVRARRAVSLEPLVSAYRNDYILVLGGLADVSAAAIQADSAIALDPGYAANYLPAAWIALAQHRMPDAEAKMRRYQQLTNAMPNYWPALMLASSGRSAEARRTIAALERERVAAGMPRRPSTFAAVYLALGDTATAVVIINEAVERREATLLRTLNLPTVRQFARTPVMKPVRARIGLPE